MSQRYIRRPQVESMTGLSRSTIYRLMDEGDFPRPVRLTGKAVGWPEQAVTDWLNSRPTTTAA